MDHFSHALQRLREEIALLGDQEIIQRGRLLESWTMCGKRPHSLHFYGEGVQRFLAGLAQLVDPTGQGAFRGRIDIDKLDPHADTGFDDTYNPKCLDLLVLAFQGDARSAIGEQWTGGAHKASAQGEIGSDAFDASAGGQIEEFGVRSKRITNGIAAIPNRGTARLAFGTSIVHRNYVAHEMGWLPERERLPETVTLDTSVCTSPGIGDSPQRAK